MQEFKGFNTGTFRPGWNGDKLDTNSVICPIPSPPVQHLLPQTWSHISKWQQPAKLNHNYVAQYHGINRNDALHTTQQDFVPFDDSGGFYNDEDDEALGHETQLSRPNDQVKGRSQRLVEANVTHGASLGPAHLANDEPQCESQQKSSTVANDRAAELRAKLIAQQRASMTPTLSRPKPKSRVEPSHNGIGIFSQAAGKKTQCCQNPINSDYQANVANGIEDKVSERISNPMGQGTSDADIDVLIAHGKAFADAGKLLNGNDTAVHLTGNQSNSTRKQLLSQEADPPVSIHDTVRQGSNNSIGSSGASELGEIKEDTVNTSHAHQSPRHSSVVLSTELTNKAALSNSSPSKAISNAKHATSTLPKDVEAKGVKTQNIRIPTSSRHIEQTASDDFAQYPAHKPGMFQSTPPSQPDTRRDRRDLVHSLRDWPGDKVKTLVHDSCLPTDELHGTRFNGRAYRSGIGQDVPNRNDRTRTQHKPISQLECSRSAAERSHDIEESSTENNGASDAIYKIRSTPATEKAPIHLNMPTVTTETANADELLTIELPDSVTGIDPSIFVNQQTYADICDWLKITGYFNVPHRTKRLEIHRKKRALELQRAELEREEQLELEQHSLFVRASSACPPMSFEPASSVSIFSPQAFRPSISNMPPPPLPPKDDMGIKIKDSANLEAISTLKSGVIDPKSEQPADHRSATVPVTKRQRTQDIDIRPDGPIDKIRRLDLEIQLQDKKKSSRSPTMKDESFESRISRNNEPRSAGYRRRSRSLGRRRRSLSPPQRRASDTGGYNSYVSNVPRVDIYSSKTSRHDSPARRNSDSRDAPVHRDSMVSGSEYEARMHEERGSYYQHQTPHRYRGRGRSRTDFTSYRNGNKTSNGRGEGQGSSIDNESSNLQEGMQPHN